MVAWEPVSHEDVVHALTEYDRLGPDGFFSAHGFGPTTTYDLAWTVTVPSAAGFSMMKSQLSRVCSVW